MTSTKTITADQVREAYLNTGSMREAGKLLGVSGARVQAILAKNGGTPTVLPRADRELLETVTRLSLVVTRGPSVAQVADALGITPRALRYRCTNLRKANLVVADSEGGLLPTDAARALLNAAQPQEDSHV
jgi:predicted transcriptional regulator